ncbi:MAG: Fic family protein [Deltaproteobacteria bacterium]|nr:Fic family protein [Deltaproteobacteria bacterium]
MYSMSAQIITEREAYYDVLTQTQRGSGDITKWIIWFLLCLKRAARRSEGEVSKSAEKALMWQEIAAHNLNERQKKVVNRLFEAGSEFEGGLTTRKYVGMTGTSRETAKRDIADLVAKEVLVRNQPGGRSTSYSLYWNIKRK